MAESTLTLNAGDVNPLMVNTKVHHLSDIRAGEQERTA